MREMSYLNVCNKKNHIVTKLKVSLIQDVLFFQRMQVVFRLLPHQTLPFPEI